jgi:hypothetical protein
VSRLADPVCYTTYTSRETLAAGTVTGFIFEGATVLNYGKQRRVFTLWSKPTLWNRMRCTACRRISDKQHHQQYKYLQPTAN